MHVVKGQIAAVVCPEELRRVEAQLSGRVGGRIVDLRLALVDGRVVLRGRTRTFYLKQLAQHTVMKELCLPLVNHIEVVDGA